MLLCFGDSNTWGANPLGGRHPQKQRWPNILAGLMMKPLTAEGQPGRTLAASNPDLGVTPDRARWQQTLATSPEYIVLALGINDLAAGASPRQALMALADYVADYRQITPLSRLIVMAPAALGLLSAPWQRLFGGMEPASGELSVLWHAYCQREGIPLLDVTPLLSPSADGLHWNGEDHQLIATALFHQFMDS